MLNLLNGQINASYMRAFLTTARENKQPKIRFVLKRYSQISNLRLPVTHRCKLVVCNWLI